MRKQPTVPSSTPLRRWTRRALGGLFIGAGVLHLLSPDAYVRIMPPYVPAHRGLVLVSGVFEIAGGVGLFVPRLRRISAWGLAALLVAVFPANVHMALHPELARGVPGWALWARLGLQPLLIALVLWSGGATGLGPAPPVTPLESE